MVRGFFMEVKDKLKVEIVDISYDGLGVAKVDGYILFVDECLIGEKVLVEITELGKNYGFAKKIEEIWDDLDSFSFEEMYSSEELLKDKSRLTVCIPMLRSRETMRQG